MLALHCRMQTFYLIKSNLLLLWLDDPATARNSYFYFPGQDDLFSKYKHFISWKMRFRCCIIKMANKSKTSQSIRKTVWDLNLMETTRNPHDNFLASLWEKWKGNLVETLHRVDTSPCCASVTLQGNLVWPLRGKKEKN